MVIGVGSLIMNMWGKSLPALPSNFPSQLKGFLKTLTRVFRSTQRKKIIEILVFTEEYKLKDMDLHSFTEGQDEKTVLYSKCNKTSEAFEIIRLLGYSTQKSGSERGIRRA